MTTTDFLRKKFNKTLVFVSSLFLKTGLTPNLVTLLGLLGNIGAALLIANGKLVMGGVIASLAGTFDAIDGTMARLSGEPSKFGCLFDSPELSWYILLCAEVSLCPISVLVLKD